VKVDIDDSLAARALPADPLAWRSEEGLKDAAVLVPIVRREAGDRLVFNLRRDDLPWHAGQVCFPGGARHGTESALECALREASEEMGVAASSVRVLGRLPDRVSIAGFRVVPIVGRVDPAMPFRPCAAEVAEVFEVPYALLFESARWSFRDATSLVGAQGVVRARFRRVPYFDAGPRVVWGLTGIILRDFVRAVGGFDPGNGETTAPADPA
jgi:8-oxo-dGTP pyrophosphatase MutT (NUDIX family)